MGQLPKPWGVTLFEMAADSQDTNTTQEQLSQLVGEARKLRQLSWSVMVVVVSEEPAFLAAFAQWCLKGRLLVWSTRLLVVTHLPLHSLRGLLTSHWTFSMMNTMFLVLDDTQCNTRCVMYSHLPYGPKGGEIVPVALWSPDRKLEVLFSSQLFPEKFTNFYGATLPLSGLNWPPFFIEYEEEISDGALVKKYKGPDGLLLTTIANALNFTFRFLPISNWVQAADCVVERESMILPAKHAVLHTRLQRYDYTYSYTFISLGFGLAKPMLKPQWQSLYYPLTDQVWASTLAVLLIMPGIIYMLNKVRKVIFGSTEWGRGIGSMMSEVFGTLLGQGLSSWLPKDSSNRVLMATWLMFAFIVGTSYRGNLIASLTLPRYPPRPETVEQVVSYVKRVTMPPFGKDWKKWFEASGSRTLERLADLMFFGPKSQEGLQQATEKRQAHITGPVDIDYWTAKNVKQVGNDPIYFARETLSHGPSAWPIPHDAPYKIQLDNVMMAVTEAGLYDKWEVDTFAEVRLNSIWTQQEGEQSQGRENGQETQEGYNSQSSSSNNSLILTHMQGPLVLLLLGIGIAALIFISEMLFRRFYH